MIGHRQVARPNPGLARYWRGRATAAQARVVGKAGLGGRYHTAPAGRWGNEGAGTAMQHGLRWLISSR